MSDNKLLDNLNEAQQQAVTSEAQHLLVIAGAGSGKTRVLVHRIAWLMRHQGINPHNVLAVTFTNKAAAEMRARIDSFLEVPSMGMWMGTFHGLAHRLLRAHFNDANLPETFQILDGDDQYRLVRRTIKALELDESRFPPKKAQYFINGYKEKGIRPEKVADASDHYHEVMLKIYIAYEDACARAGLVDFPELILRSYELLRDNASLREHYQSRFTHILVDEFQDTNPLQYLWIALFVGESNHLVTVGDDDQSIYSWRGACIDNIHRLGRDYPDLETVRLEQNYRSTSNILDAANALIENNEDRMGKSLWTEGSRGELISLYSAFNELDEARFIVDRAKAWINDGNSASEIAILYRSNAQSRVLEEAFLREAIPYRVYGGLRFFERAEIKDALAYLRLMVNRNDDASFERVVNTPTRGIGERSLEKLRACARAHHCTLWSAAQMVIDESLLPARSSSAIQRFIELIENMAKDTEQMSLAEQIDHMLQVSTLLAYYRSERGEKAQARVENLEELVNAGRQYVPKEDQSSMRPIEAFLSHAALEAGEGQADAFEQCVQLMTLHSAKGLEFPLVFIAGVEEGLFPHYMSLDNARGLEEERRLCYVGMTRAMQKLFMCYAQIRTIHGQEKYHTPSRFINEIPKDYIEEIRMQRQVQPPRSGYSGYGQSGYGRSGGGGGYRSGARPGATTRSTFQGEVAGFRMGQAVVHPVFGEGVVTNFEGDGHHARIQVQFNNGESKWLVAAYAKLEALG